MPLGRTKSNIVADEPMATATRGDGICRSKSNAADGAVEVVVTAETVVVGATSAIVVAVVPGILLGATASGTSVAATIGAVVVVGLVGAGASTTLFLTTVVVGLDFTMGFGNALTVLLAVFFAGCFLMGFVAVTVPIAALDLGVLKKDSALTTRATEANGARNRRD